MHLKRRSPWGRTPVWAHCARSEGAQPDEEAIRIDEELDHAFLDAGVVGGHHVVDPGPPLVSIQPVFVSRCRALMSTSASKNVVLSLGSTSV